MAGMISRNDIGATYVCASLKDRAKSVTVSSRAATTAARSRAETSRRPMVAGVMVKLPPIIAAISPPPSPISGRKMRRSTVPPSTKPRIAITAAESPKVITARNLPNTTSVRRTGATRSTSSVPRSFSPAVASMAVICPPVSVQMAMKKGMSQASWPELRSASVDASAVATAIGRSTAGSRPAPRRRSATSAWV